MKPRIVSVSRRTDIPAFYADWFIRRVREGYCVVRNPLFPERSVRVSLKPEDVLAFVFWTRDPRPLMKYLPELDKAGYACYFSCTLIGYPREIDPASPALKTAVETFRELGAMIGKERMVWRYDPVLFSNITPESWHLERAGYLMDALAGYTQRMVISFLDPYQKTRLRLSRETGPAFALSPRAFEPAEYAGLCRFIGGKAAEAKMEVQTCAEEADLSAYGILPGKCIDAGLVARIRKTPVDVKKSRSQRKACGCDESIDIGAYDTCLAGCRYCYATRSMEAAAQNCRRHLPDSPSLI